MSTINTPGTPRHDQSDTSADVHPPVETPTTDEQPGPMTAHDPVPARKRKAGPVIIKVDHLSKKFRLYHERNQSLKQSLLQRKRADVEEFWALKDISFDVHEGETFGVIGHNGSGKSTMLKCLTQILQPDGGAVTVNGSVSALLELGAGFHPELSGRENVYLNAAILGVPRKQIEARFDDIVTFAGLEKFIDSPVKNYSSGMFVRLGFAVAINVDPDILIIDEVLSVGDAEFQARCGDRIAEFRERGKTLVLVTHSMADAVRICHRAIWIDHGQMRMIGKPTELADAYLQTTHAGRTVRYNDDMRWGNGDVKIESVRLLNKLGDPLDYGRTGESLTVEIDLVSERPIERPEVGMSIYDRDSNLITSLSTRSRHREVDVVDGRRAVRFEIASLPLVEGSYEATFAVVDSSGQREFDVRSRFLRFDVLKGETNDGGLITLDGAWTL